MNKPVDFWTNTLAKLGLKRRVKRGKRCELKHRTMRLEQLQSREMLTTDLAVASFASDGEDWVVTYDVTDEAASAFDIGIYRSSDGVTADSLLQTKPVSNTADLAVGTGHVLEITPDFPNEDEDYYLIVRLDDADENAESSETNNEAVFSGGMFLNRDETHVYDESTGALTTEIDALGRRTGYEWDASSQLVQTILPAADEAGPTLDDSSSAGYAETGSWQDGGSYRYVSGGGGVNIATWQFDGLDADKCYDVYLTWSADSANASDAPFTVYDGTPSTETVLDTVTVDQTTSPDPDSWVGGAWQYAGTYSLSGSTLSVALSDAVTTGYVVADSVMVLERSFLQNVYNQSGLLVQSIDEAGLTTTYGYDAQDRLETVTRAGLTTETVYNASGQVAATVDGLGNITEYEYDASGRLVKTYASYSDSDAAIQVDTDDAESRLYLTSVGYDSTCVGGDYVTFDSSSSYARYVISDLEPGTSYELWVTYPESADATTATYTVYDGWYVSTLALDPYYVDQSQSPSGSSVYGDQWHYLGDVTPSGTLLTLNVTGGAGVVADAVMVVEARAVTAIAYNSEGQIYQETDAYGAVTEYAYDSSGRVIEMTSADPDGDGSLESPVTRTYYDSSGRVTGTIDPVGTVTTFQYDSYGRQTASYVGQVIAPSDEGYAEISGEWSDASAGLYGAARSANSATASWTFENLTVGDEYDIYVTWTADSVNTNQAQFAVYWEDASGSPISEDTIDQTVAPAEEAGFIDFSDASFQKLTTVTATSSESTTIVVTLSNSTSSFVQADAVYLVRKTPANATEYDAAGQAIATLDADLAVTAVDYDGRGRAIATYSGSVIDDASASGFATTGSWTSITGSGLLGACLTVDSTDDITAKATATWTFEDLAVGDEYAVYITWTSQATSSSTVPVSIYEANTGTVWLDSTFSQSSAPVQASDLVPFSDQAFAQLGSVLTVTDSTLVVEVSNYTGVSGEVVSVDAVYVLRTDAVSQSVYDSDGLLVASIAAEGEETTYAYDSLGRLSVVTGPDPDGSEAPVNRTYYNSLGQTSASIGPEGATETYAYDDLGRLTATCGGQTIWPGEDGYDEPTTTWTTVSGGFSGSYRTTTISATEPADATWTFTDLEPGEEYEVYVTWTADSANTDQAHFAIYLDSTTGTAVYDDTVDQTVDPDQPVEFAGLGDSQFQLLTSYELHEGDGTTLVVQLSNDSGTAGATVVADAVFLVRKNATSQSIYDSAGRLVASLDDSGCRTDYTYDNLGRLTEVALPDPDGDGPLARSVTQYVYDAAGRVVSVVENAGESLAYDQRGAEFRRVLGDTVDIGAYEGVIGPQTSSYVVDTLVDVVDGDYSSGNLSLREAIYLAGQNAGHDLITFADGLSGTIALVSDHLLIDSDLTIEGPGADVITIHAGGDSTTNRRAFYISGDITAMISGFTLTGGYETYGGAVYAATDSTVTLSDLVVIDNDAVYYGGGIYTAYAESLTIENCTITENSSVYYGGGIAGNTNRVYLYDTIVSCNTVERYYGAGIAAYYQNLEMVDCVVSDNVFSSDSYSGRYGAGLFLSGGIKTTIIGTTIENNQADDVGEYNAAYGGGIAALNLCETYIIDCTIGSNEAVTYGGGIYYNGGSLEVSGTTVEENVAGSWGGGFYVRVADFAISDSLLADNEAVNGGGLSVYSAEASLTNLTVSGNTASNSGGGLFLSGDETCFTHLVGCTITGNSAVYGGGLYRYGLDVRLDNTIVAGNSATGSNYSDLYGSYHEGSSNNLIGVRYNVTGFTGRGNLVGTLAEPIAPLLGALAYNGGSTKTHMPQSDSPALDAGSSVLAAGYYDARGENFYRTIGEATDIGAVEYNTVNLLVDEFTDGSGTTLQEAITAANATSGADTITFSAGLDFASEIDIVLSGQLEITEDLTIIGPGADQLAISGDDLYRIFDLAEGITVRLVGMTLTAGLATGAGGAIRSLADELTLEQCQILNSAATTDGGAIYATGVLNLLESTLAHNSATDGGAIMLHGAAAFIRQSTIAENTANTGGGIALEAAGSATILQSTIVANEAAGTGGGLHVGYGSVVMHNTLVAGNSAVAAYPDVAGKLLAESSYNLVSNGSGMAGVADGSQGNLVGTIASPIDALLGELGYHGGSVQTVPLRVDSPALDAGSAEWATSQIGSSATISYDLLGGVIRGGVVFLETVDTTFPEGTVFTATARQPLLGSPVDGTVQVDYGDGSDPEIVTVAADGSFLLNHCYGTHGVYDLTITTTWDDGCVSVTVLSLTVTGEGPDASIAGSYTVEENGSITLDASASTDPTGDRLYYYWDLDGDGIYAETGPNALYGDETGVSPTFTATDLDGPGSIEVSVKVIDASGYVDIASTTISVTNAAPEPDAGGPYAAEQNSTFTLDASNSTDVSGDALSYAWDFDGDGLFDDATGETPAFDTSLTGYYSVGLRVTDEDGATADTTAEVTIFPSDAGDIVVDSFTAYNPAEVAGDRDLLVHYSITDNNVAAFTIAIYTTTDGETPGTLLTSERISDALNLLVDTDRDVRIPADFTDPGGEYQLLAVIDTGAEVLERNEANNRLLFEGGVIEGTDGTVYLHGSDDDNAILLEESDESGVAIQLDSIDWGVVDSPTALVIQLHGGNDSVTTSPLISLPLTAYGGEGEDWILGGAGDDVLYGGADGDALFGGCGEDTLYGQEGDDLVSGDADNDTLYGGMETAGQDSDTGNDTIYGAAGDDYIYAGAGDDLVYAGNGVDVVYGNSGDDEIYGGLGNDSLFGEAGYDVLDGGGDDDYVSGGDGADTLAGGDGNDTLLGGYGADALSGDDGDDILYGDLGANDQDASAGNDSLDGGAGDDTLYGEDGSDDLYGGDGDDSLYGGYGTDSLYGDGGSDWLDTDSTEAADDQWQGGAGFDTPELLDDSHVEYVESGTWLASSSGLFDGQRVAESGTGENVARWTFTDLPADTYDVYVIWEDDVLLDVATDAPFTVYDDETLLTTVSVDQTAGGATWTSLGSWTVESGVLVVELTDNANGVVLADAVKLLRQNSAPIVSLGSDINLDEGEAMAVEASFTDADGDNDTWTATVDYGDGSAVQTLEFDDDNQFVLDHAFADNGVYTVTVTVTDDEGAVGTDSLTATVANVAPSFVLGLPEDDILLATGVPVTVDLTAVDPGDDTITSWTVSWGDGQSDTITDGSESVSHVYSAVEITGAYVPDTTSGDHSWNSTGEAFAPDDSSGDCSWLSSVHVYAPVASGGNYSWDSVTSSYILDTTSGSYILGPEQGAFVPDASGDHVWDATLQLFIPVTSGGTHSWSDDVALFIPVSSDGDCSWSNGAAGYVTNTYSGDHVAHPSVEDYADTLQISVSATDEDGTYSSGNLEATIGEPNVSLTEADGSIITSGTSTVDFGTTGQGTPVDVVLWVENSGAGDLVIDRSTLSLPDGYSEVIALEEVVEPGEQSLWVLRMDADLGGTVSGQVQFSCNDENLTTFAFTVTASVTVPASPTLSDFGLLCETGDYATCNPILTGKITGDLDGGYVVMEFDHDDNEASDGAVTVDASPDTFVYDPREFDSAFPSSGSVSVYYRMVQYDASDNVVATGDWTQFSYTLETPPAASVSISSLELEEDTCDDDPADDEDGANHTSNMTLIATVGSADTGSSYIIEFKQDNVAAGESVAYFHDVTTVDENGDEETTTVCYATYLPEGLEFGDSVTVQARVVEYSVEYDMYLYSAWSDGIIIRLVPDSPPGIVEDSFVLANDTGDDDTDGITEDPTLTGSVDDSFDDVSGVLVAFDHDGDGEAEGYAWTDEDGAFTYTPTGIEVGVATTIYAWTSRTFELTEEGVTTPLYSITLTTAPVALAPALTYTPATVFPEVDQLGLAYPDESIADQTDTQWIYGAVTGDDVEGVLVALEYDSSNSEVDGWALTDEDGLFTFYVPDLAPTAEAPVTVTVDAWTYAWDEVTQAYIEGTAQQLTFTLVAPDDDVAISVATLELVEDSGWEDEYGVICTYNPALTGTLANDGDVAYAYVEFQYNSQIIGTTTADADGVFTFVPTTLPYETVTVEARAREWDYQNQAFKEGEWISITFDYKEFDIPAPAVSSVSLYCDTGTSSTDKITANNMITGVISDDHYFLEGVVIEIDVDNDGTVDGTTTTDADGCFFYDPGLMAYAQQTIQVRAKRWDANEAEYDAADNPDGKWETGSWYSLVFTYEAQVDAAPLPTELAMSTDVDDSTELVTPDALVTGRLINERFHSGITVELDLDGDAVADRTTTVDDQGDFTFSLYDLVDTATYTVYVRARELSSTQSTELVSSWVSCQFTYTAPVNSPAEIDEWSLVYDTDTTGDAPTAADPTITGTVSNDEYLEDLIVQFDLDDDGVADASVLVDSDGTFVYEPLGLETGDVVIDAWVKEYDSDGTTLIGDSITIEFTYEDDDDTLAVVESLALYHDSGASSTDLSTDDATITGRIEGSGDLYGTVVEIDEDGDGVADGTAVTDAGGNFTYTPEDLDAGVVTLDVRTVDSESGETSDWTSLTFVYSDDPDGEDDDDGLDEEALADALATWLSDTEAIDDAYDTAVENAIAAYEARLASSESTYDSALASAALQQATTLASARSTLYSSLSAAQTSYAAAMLANAVNFSTDLTAYAAQGNDITSYTVPEFTIADAPADTLSQHLASLDQPDSGIQAPTYQGPSFDFEQDPDYKNAVSKAGSKYAADMKAAAGKYDTDCKAAETTYEASVKAANKAYNAAKDAAEAAKQADLGNIENNCPINLSEASGVCELLLQRLQSTYEGDKLELEAAYEALALQLSLDYPQPGPDEDEAEEVTQGLIDHPENYYNSDEKSRNIEVDFADMYEDIDTWIVRALAVRDLKYSNEQVIAELLANCLKSQYAASESLSLQGIARTLWIDQEKARIQETYDKALADAANTRDLAVSAAEETRIGKYADAQKVYDLAATAAQNTRTASLVTAQVTAISKWETTINGEHDEEDEVDDDWSNMCRQLAIAAQTFITDMNLAIATHAENTAAKTAQLVKDVAAKSRAKRDTEIANAKTLAYSKAGASATKSSQEAQARADQGTARCQASTVRLSALADADKDESIAVAKADWINGTGYDSGFAAYLTSELSWIEGYVDEFNSIDHHHDTGDGDWEWFEPWCCIVHPTESERQEIWGVFEDQCVLNTYNRSVSVVQAEAQCELAKSEAEYNYSVAVNEANKTYAHSLADHQATYSKAVSAATLNQQLENIAADVKFQNQVTILVAKASSELAELDTKLTATVVEKEAALASTQATLQDTYMTGEASAYAAAIGAWASGLGTNWSGYVNDLATAESDRVESLGNTLATYTTKSSSASASYVTSASKNDLSFLTKDNAATVAADGTTTDAQLDYLKAAAKSQQTYSDALADALATYTKSVATAAKAKADTDAAAEKAKADTETCADCTCSIEVLTQNYLANINQEYTGASAAIAAANTAKAVSYAAAACTHTKSLAAAAMTQTISNAAAKVSWVAEVVAAASTLSSSKVTNASALLSSTSGAVDAYYTAAEKATKLYGTTSTKNEVTLANQLSDATGNLNTGLDATSSEAGEDASEALGDYEKGVYEDFQDNAQDLATADPTNLNNYYLKTADAQVDWAGDQADDRDDYTSDTSDETEDFTTDQNGVDKGLAKGTAQTDGDLSSSISVADVNWAGGVSVSAADLNTALVVAELTRDSDIVKASGAYQNAAAAAESAYTAAVAAYDYAVACANADTLYNSAVPANKQVDVVTPPASDFTDAADAQTTALANAKVQLASDLGDAGVNYAKNSGAAEVAFTASMNSTETEYTGSASASLQSWVDTSGTTALSYAMGTLSALSGLASGLYDTVAGYLTAMTDTDADCVEGVAGADIDYQISDSTDKVADEQSTAASIGTKAARFVADSSQAVLTWLSKLGSGTSDLNDDGVLDSADSSFAATSRAYSVSESDHGVDLVEASAAYSAALDRNEADFTLSYGTVQNALTSDLTEAATTYEKGVVEALNALSLAEAKADLDRAVEIAEQQKANAIAAVQEEYGDTVAWEQTFDRMYHPIEVATAIADKLWRGTVTDAQSTFEDTVSALASAFEATVDARQKAATTDASRLVGELQVADAEALADYWSDKIEADNTQFSTDVDTSVDWKSEDYSAQADALLALNADTTAANDDNEVPWAKFLADKAAYVYNWWTDDSDPNTTCGSDLYRDWADDVNESYSAYATASGAAYLSMAGTIAAANDTYYASTPDDNVDDDDGDADDLPDVSSPDGAERWSAAMAEAESDYLDSLAAAELQLAVSTEAAGENAEELADAQAAYDAAVSAAVLAYQVAAAQADGDAAIADAEAVDDYIDDVYGEDGDYDTWQSAVTDAESAYEAAASSAWSGLQKSLAAHDAALESALADTYAKAMEELADDFPGNPWAARAAADARAESTKIADDQSAQSAYADSVNDAQVAFDTALATADATRTESQTDALRTSLQTQSEAALTKATNQATADTEAAGDGVGTAAVPSVAETEEVGDDATAVFDTDEDQTTGTFVAPEPLDPAILDALQQDLQALGVDGMLSSSAAKAFTQNFLLRIEYEELQIAFNALKRDAYWDGIRRRDGSASNWDPAEALSKYLEQRMEYESKLAKTREKYGRWQLVQGVWYAAKLQVAYDRAHAGERALDDFQAKLDVVGLAPGVGEPADGVNAVVYLLRGEYKEAAISGIAIFTILGDSAKGPRVVKYAWSDADNFIELAKVARTADNVRDATAMARKREVLSRLATQIDELARRRELGTSASGYNAAEEAAAVVLEGRLGRQLTRDETGIADWIINGTTYDHWGPETTHFADQLSSGKMWLSLKKHVNGIKCNWAVIDTLGLDSAQIKDLRDLILRLTPAERGRIIDLRGTLGL